MDVVNYWGGWCNDYILVVDRDGSSQFLFEEGLAPSFS
jgi:hypothetical protein